MPRTCILTGAEGENPDDCTTHNHEPRWPDAIMTDLDELQGILNSLHASNISRTALRDLLWEVIADIDGSYELAMQGIGLNVSQRSEVTTTVGDYLSNAYGDD